MLFYDIDLYDHPIPEPVSDEAYAERISIYNTLVPSYKDKLRRALGTRQARRIDASFKEFIDRNSYGDLDTKTWSSMLEAMLEMFCHASITNKIRYTPNKYKHKWTAEELDQMIDACELDEHFRVRIYKEAGLECPQRTHTIAATGA